MDCFGRTGSLGQLVRQLGYGVIRADGRGEVAREWTERRPPRRFRVGSDGRFKWSRHRSRTSWRLSPAQHAAGHFRLALVAEARRRALTIHKLRQPMNCSFHDHDRKAPAGCVVTGSPAQAWSGAKLDHVQLQAAQVMTRVPRRGARWAASIGWRILGTMQVLRCCASCGRSAPENRLIL